MLQFAATCYHLVGTGVVRCEAGTDLHPLSAFRAVDGMLAGRDSSAEQLSETAIFIEAFMGFALDSIHAMAAPSQIIDRSEEHTSELQSLMRISYAVFCLKKQKTHQTIHINTLEQTQYH